MDHSHMDHGNHSHDHMDHSMDHMDMMKMYFHFDLSDTVLFKGWKPTTAWEMTYSCLAVIAFGIAFEGLKYLREVVQSKQLQSDSYGGSFIGQLVDVLHLIQTILHGLQYLLSYCLMLIAMTYQVYLFFSIVIGCSIGYLIFTPLSAKLRAKYVNFGDPCCG